jgi:hypothetical protein
MPTRRTNPAFQRALNCLSHPGSVAAVIILLLNAVLFQRLWPSWWTGKIGDVAWLVFTPFLLASALAWLIPAGTRQQEKTVGWLALGLVGLSFTLVKTVPAFNAGAAGLFKMLTGFPAKLAPDATDLAALPALVPAWRLWNKPPVRPLLRPSFRWFALGLAVVAVMADSPAPTDLGVTCLGVLDSSLLAFQESIFHGEFSSASHDVAVYQSTDGGLHWRRVMSSRYDAQKPPTPSPDGTNAALLEFAKCTVHDSGWQLPDPTHDQVLYAFITGQGIYRSEDAGQTLHKEASLTESSVLDARVDEPSGNVLVALGVKGLMVRTPDGAWQSIAPDKLAGP